MATFEVENGRLYQWDIGRTIKVSPEMGEAIDEVHFAYGTDEDALRRELYDGKAEIPNVLLQRHGQMRVWAVVNDEDGRQTIQNAYLNVRERNKPEDYIYTDEEVRRYEELEARLDEETGKYNEVDERLDRLENDKNYVISVNGKMGEVELGAADVGAVESVNGEKGKVILSAEDVGALPVINGSISIGKTTSTTSNSFTLNRRYDSITTQTAKFGIAGEELSISMSEKVTPASGGTHTTTGTISVSPRKTSFTTPLYFTSAPVKSRTRENLDIYSKEEVDEAILEATKNNGDEEAVKIVPQELSTDQQEQARNNIDVYSKTEVDDIIEELEIDKAVESVNGMTGEVVLTAADVGAFPSTGGKVSGSVTATGTLIAGQGNTYTARLASASNMAMLSAVNKSGSMVNSIQLYSDRTMLNQPLAVSSGGHGGKNAAEGRKNLEVDSSTEVDDKIAAQVGQITPATIGAIADQDGIIRERHLGAQVVKNGNIAYGAVSDSRIAEKTITFQRLSDACVEDIKAAALPTASADVKGGVMVGPGLQMDGDVLNVQDKVFTHIETFTFGEDMAFERTQEPSGRAYAFDAIALQINKPAGVTIDKAISIGVIFTGSRISQPLYFVPCSKTEDLWMLATVENYKGLARRTRTTDWAIYNSTSAVNEVPFLMFDNALRKGEVIQRISTNQIIPAGLIFEIWGVRANA